MASSIEIITNNVKHRINELDKNYMCFIVGQTGSGKSATAIEFARHVDPTFETNPRIVFTSVEFLETIKTMKKGQAIVFDEAGVGIPAREWQQVQNKIVGYVTQLFRHLNLCVIFTVPSMSFVEKQVRTLIHAVIETRTIDYTKKIGVSKYWVMNHNAVFDLTRLELFVHFKDGKHSVIDPLYVPFPPDELWKQYITMKEAYAKLFYENTLTALKEDTASMDAGQIKKLKRQSESFIKSLPLLREHYTWDTIAEATGVPKRSLQDWVKNDSENAQTAQPC